MPTEDTRYTFDRVVRMVLSATTIVVIILLLRYLSDVLLPFAAAVILAYLLNPIVTGVEKRVKRRGLAVGITLFGLGILGLVFLFIVLPLMVDQLSGFESSLTDLREDLGGTIQAAELAQETTHPAISGNDPLEAAQAPPTSAPAAEGVLPNPSQSKLGFKELAEGWADFRSNKDELPRAERLHRLMGSVSGTYIGTLLTHAAEFVRTQEFRELFLSTVKRLAVGGVAIINIAVQMVLGVTALVVVLIYLVFLLLDFPEYARTWPSFLPPTYRDPIVAFLTEFDVALRRYFRGQFVVACCVGVLFAIGFSIIGLPMAIPLGLFIGALNMIPYLQIVGLVPSLLLACIRSIETGDSVLVSVLLVLAVFAVVQTIQDAIITPRVMGKVTGLRPVAILLGIFVWGKLLGFLGLLLAIPLTCLGIAYYRRFVLHRADAM